MNTLTQLQRARWFVQSPNPRRASLRYRCLYPMQQLERWGYSVGFLSNMESSSGLTAVFDAWTLFPTISMEREADAVVATVRKLRRDGARIVLDNCDNQFANEHPGPSWANGLERLREVSQLADRIVVCSDSLARAMCEHTKHDLPTIVIDDPLEEKIQYPGDTMIRSALSLARKHSWWQYLRHRSTISVDRRAARTPLVWFGSQGNHFAPGGMLDLLSLKTILEETDRHYPLSLTIISNNRSKFSSNFTGWRFPVHYVDWDRINFLAALRLHDMSIIPALLNEFTRCKSTNRVTLSLHHGLAVIADPVPSYLDYAQVIRVGDWNKNLEAYLSNQAARERDVANGQILVREKNSISSIARQWKKVLFEN